VSGVGLVPGSPYGAMTWRQTAETRFLHKTRVDPPGPKIAGKPGKRDLVETIREGGLGNERLAHHFAR